MGAIFAETQEFRRWAGKRKHHTQMKSFEVKNLWNRLNRVKNWEVDAHAFDRVQQKGINATKDDIVTTLLNATIIEYKIDYDRKRNFYDERVVLRSNAVVNGMYNLHAVYSLTTGRIKTVWINHIKDTHHTLDWSRYNPKMKVFA